MCIDDSCSCNICGDCEYYCSCPWMCEHGNDVKKEYCHLCQEEEFRLNREWQEKVGKGCLDVTGLGDYYKMSRPCLDYPNCVECKKIRGE